MRIRHAAALAPLLAVLGFGAAAAQTPPPATSPAAPPAGETPASPPAQPAPAPAPAAAPKALAGTLITVVLQDASTSRTAKVGDRLAIKLRDAVKVDGVEIIPAGVRGEVEVIDAAPATGAGHAGKLLLAARWIEVRGQKVPIRTLRLGRGGTDESTVANAMGLAGGIAGGLLSLAVKGGEVEFAVGTAASAKLAADVEAPTAGAAPAAAPATAPTTTPNN